MQICDILVIIDISVFASAPYCFSLYCFFYIGVLVCFVWLRYVANTTCEIDLLLRLSQEKCLSEPIVIQKARKNSSGIGAIEKT